MINLKNRDFINLLDFSSEEIAYFIDLAASLKKEKKSGNIEPKLKGKNIVLIFEKDSTRTRCAFEVAAFDEGAHVTYLGPSGSHMGKKESVKDTARVLGRFYDAIEYRGYCEEIVSDLAKYSGVPVWNGLTTESHPTQILADFLTMQEHSDKPLSQVKFCYIGYAGDNMANTMMAGAALMGMDFRIAAPEGCFPSEELTLKCLDIAKKTGAKITFYNDVNQAVKGCDFIHTDVWVSMGEPESLWQERIKFLTPYKVTKQVMDASGNPNCKFMHCLPAFHNLDTKVGVEIFEKYGITEMEVTEEVFESEASIVFDQAENRMHTIKAVMVATLAENI